MAARPGEGQEAYPFPSNDARGPSNANIPWKYHDNESDNQVSGCNGDSQASQNNHGLQDGKHDYDHNNPYDPYSM